MKTKLKQFSETDNLFALQVAGILFWSKTHWLWVEVKMELQQKRIDKQTQTLNRYEPVHEETNNFHR